MSNDYSPELITIVDEDDVEHNFEILDRIDFEDREYYALLPVYENPEDMIADSGEYYIMETVDAGDGWELAEVDDDELIDKLAAIFEERFEQNFSEE